MKTYIVNLKAELKVLAKQIRELKKTSRSNNSVLDKRFPNRGFSNHHQWKILQENKELQAMCTTFWSSHSALLKAQFEFRSKHIAYCMLRGRTLDQIENKIRDPHSYTHVTVRKEAAKIVASALETLNIV